MYGHIKEAMELAEEARLERDAALQRQAAAAAQVTVLQVGTGWVPRIGLVTKDTSIYHGLRMCCARA